MKRLIFSEDIFHTLAQMEDKDAGQMAKAIACYAHDGTQPKWSNTILMALFSLFKKQIDIQTDLEREGASLTRKTQRVGINRSQRRRRRHLRQARQPKKANLQSSPMKKANRSQPLRNALPLSEWRQSIPRWTPLLPSIIGKTIMARDGKCSIHRNPYLAISVSALGLPIVREMHSRGSLIPRSLSNHREVVHTSSKLGNMGMFTSQHYFAIFAIIAALIYCHLLTTQYPFFLLPILFSTPIRFRYAISRLTVASDSPVFIHKLSLVRVLSSRNFCSIMLCLSVSFIGSFIGSFNGSFSKNKVSFTCISSGCSINSGFIQCFSFHAFSMSGNPEPRFSP